MSMHYTFSHIQTSTALFILCSRFAQEIDRNVTLCELKLDPLPVVTFVSVLLHFQRQKPYKEL